MLPQRLVEVREDKGRRGLSDRLLARLPVAEERARLPPADAAAQLTTRAHLDIVVVEVRRIDCDRS